ncbi:hypothetical protein [Comamonas endophytica]|uniref:F0F1-ATPase subunit (Ca2+/Mg2+ transporter) n=1 Tax=Comamonas endophytica TaxID=2949090 RepID=A0ABY6G6Q1_9BURK|nr:MULTISPECIES: hypothetical protein [unclassified Acidovorax]MCD2511305.1 hypothetical protein [Acidovorax sp. D4N7]UYG50699.1 hypothetical protein M9799_11410 [Acidovorax sp. 5MLIR]
MTNVRKMLVEGLSDALGFLVGALLGYGAGRLLGLDLFASGYGPTTLAAIVLIGLFGGAGLQAARIWRSERDKPEAE